MFSNTRKRRQVFWEMFRLSLICFNNIHRALNVARELSDPKLKKPLWKIIDGLERGNNLTRMIGESPLFSPLEKKIMEIAEDFPEEGVETICRLYQAGIL